jgi:glycosyltransferase involved in cell wall biosynthesis
MFHRAHRALYAAFDRFPSRKGAAIHIDRFARTLFDCFDGGVLFCLGGAGLPAHQRDGDVEIVRFSAEIENFLARANAYGAALERVLDELAPSLELVHFRDPWSGAPIALRPHRYATVYEVNALPSIELPYLFDELSPRTLEKIRAVELACCEAADAIVTPSRTTASFLAGLGVDREKIRVIPNGGCRTGALACPTSPTGEGACPTLLYFGAPQPWQGVETLLRAFALLRDIENAKLLIIGSHDSRAWRPYQRLAEKLNIAVEWQFELDPPQLAERVRGAYVSVAPLTDTPRNTLQGCAPLKIVESMAAGVPVVASDVPPVRELIAHRENGWLVHPDRPGELARALRILLDHPQLARALGDRARETVPTWDEATAALRAEYGRIHAGSAACVPLAQ